ncbi:MAG TPA: sodium:solute symporter family protein [Burkholderiales bacterium]|nr:sodium:solute symporter family protein [Burkholderiales bacterium]
MLLWFVVIYLAVSIGIGLYAASRVHNTRDYAVAGRSLPFYVVIATVFATWFGSETVLGIPAKFLEKGLSGIVEDPFGSSMCLVLVGLFFAAKLYKMDLLTIGDFYRERYNPAVELLTSLAIVASYLGWVSAQIVALGLVFNVISGGALSLQTGIMLGASIVVVYTLLGGMYSVAWTDFMQMTLIIVGLLYIAWFIGGEVGGVAKVIEHADGAGKLRFFPEPTLRDILWFLGAAVTMMFGSIPQQDVFQRVTSARTVKISVWATVFGGICYFLFAFVPIFLGYSASLIDPKLVQEYAQSDPQHILPNLILNHTPVFAQIMFFGALLSAIMSTASGTLLAPSVIFTENVLKRFLKKDLSDKRLLWTMRSVVAGFAVMVTMFALNSESSIYEMVGNAYKVTLVGAFVPLVAGLYWKRTTATGALLSIVFGFGTWFVLEYMAPDGLVPPQLGGLVAAVVWIIIGSLATQRTPRPHPRAAS